ncbi:MAG TPA: PSD1 and planctomycete cytochrome C domain-containing protein [Chryseosolibacter sp.]
MASFFKRGRILVVVLLATAVTFFIIWRQRPQQRANRIPETVSYNFHIRPIISDRCFKCHGPDANQRKADLRLDTEEGLYKALKEDAESHVIVPGDAEHSELFLRIASTDTSMLMPPPSSNLALTDFEIKLIRKWIDQGAKYEKHWAFNPPKQTKVPETDSDWPTNEIDHFILSKLEEEGLAPNEQADKARLLKRVSFDLIGLPPDLKTQEEFLNSEAPDAYEKLVDQLLASKHYGEKMAIHWLDVARYADSHGYQDDGYRTMWPWRDWVIHAFNQNYSYDKFLTWQLAGDLLDAPTKEMLLATGFNRNHKITQEGGVIDEEYRIEYVTDRTNTFGKAFLGLTFECAKCHDHKYDPISQKDYFSTFAFFNQLNEKGLQGDIQLASLADPPRIWISNDEVKNILTFINKKDRDAVPVMIMKDSTVTRPTHVLIRGAYDAPGETVSAKMPSSIFPYDSLQFGKNRLGLAKWLLSKEHPLTSRVFVNRIWQEFFGRGIVKTAGDFGMQGELPTHPELLDWLALDFMNNGWNVKRLVKQIVMSSTYRQSSEMSKSKMAIDPENAYLWHGPRMRLPSELVKDHVLASSGLLVPEIGGPSVKPYQPKGIWESSTSGRGVLAYYAQDHDDKLYRRGMYNFIKRTVPPPVMLLFDASNRDQCEVKRMRTNTPLQALVMMNDPMVLEASRVLAERLSLEKISNEEKISKAFRLILCREPAKNETEILVKHFEEEKNQFEKDHQKAKEFIKQGEYKHEAVENTVELASLMQVIHTMYNMDEAITK